jgi:hypothetical protein
MTKVRSGGNKAGDRAAEVVARKHTAEIEADLRELAQRHKIKYLIALAADDDGLHSVALAPEPWIVKGLDKAVRQAVLAVGLTAMSEVQNTVNALGRAPAPEHRNGRPGAARGQRKRSG